MLANDLLTDRQPDARAPRAFGRFEDIEDLRQQFRCNSGTVVDDRDANQARFG